MDDEEFTEPMKDSGTSSLELLLNGLFPVKTKLSLQALDASGKVMHKRFGRAAIAAGYTPFKGDIDSIRFVVEIDAPYFVKGQSVVELRITESLGWFRGELKKNDITLALEDPDAQITSTSISIRHFNNTPSTESDLSDGEFLDQKSGRLVIVRSINASSKELSNISLNDHDFTAWVRISSNHMAPLDSKDTIFFPYRKQSIHNGDEGNANTSAWNISNTSSLRSS